MSKAPAGDYSVTVSGEGAVKLDGDKTQKLTLAAKQRGRLRVPVAASTAGASTISVSVAGPNGFTLERAYALNVRPANAAPDAPHGAQPCRAARR